VPSAPPAGVTLTTLTGLLEATVSDTSPTRRSPRTSRSTRPKPPSTGHTSCRLHNGTIVDYAATSTHVGRLIAACWRLGAPGADLDPTTAIKNAGRLSYTRLRRWATGKLCDPSNTSHTLRRRVATLWIMRG
jgi:hypothetical protein